MDAASDTQILGLQLQSILDTANKALSVEQVQLLAREFQEATDSTAEPGARHPRKRKANHCDGTNCGTTPPPMKRRIQASNIDIPSESQAGRFKCACSEWISLRDENGFTLAPWVAHLLVCKQSNTLDSTSQVDEPDATKDSILTKLSSTLSPTSQPVLDLDNDQSGSISAVVRTEPSPSPKATRTSLPQAMQAIKPEIAPSPNSERASGPDESATTDELHHITDSGSSIAKLPSDSHVKELSPQGVRWDAPPKQRRPNRTEAERIQEFHADPHVAEVEPYRVRCALCNKWIKLRNNSRYCSIPWKCHRDGCTRMHGIPNELNRPSAVSACSTQDVGGHSATSFTTKDSLSSPTSRQPPTLNSSTEHPPASNTTRPPIVDPTVPPPSVHPSLQLHTTSHLVSSTQSKSSTLANGSDTSIAASEFKEPRRARLRDAEVRRAALEADPHTEIVEPDRILCSVCKKWVKLRPNSTYCSAPWYSHIQRCISRMKRIEATSESTSGNSTMPDKLNSSYYRKTYEVDNTEDPRVVNEQAREPYYKGTLMQTLQDTSTTLVHKKRRGRPPKNNALEPTLKGAEDGVDSEVSYESEEQ